MKEEFAELEGFNLYQVSNYGYVINIKTGRQRKTTVNQQGIGMVSLRHDNLRIYTMSVSKLVADAFLYNEYDPEIFNTVINLDGDRANAHLHNLMWRPRWFAIKYHRQFGYTDFRISDLPFQDRETREEFRNFKEACTRYGLYFIDVINSCDFHKPVFPTQQQFRWIR